MKNLSTIPFLNRKEFCSDRHFPSFYLGNLSARHQEGPDRDRFPQGGVDLDGKAGPGMACARHNESTPANNVVHQ